MRALRDARRLAMVVSDDGTVDVIPELPLPHFGLFNESDANRES